MKTDRERGPHENITKITKLNNLGKITSQASGRHKNDKYLTRTWEGDPTNVTKITNLAKITTQASDSNKNGITTLEDGQVMGAPRKYYKNNERKKYSEDNKLKQATDTKGHMFKTEKGRRPTNINENNKSASIREKK